MPATMFAPSLVRPVFVATTRSTVLPFEAKRSAVRPTMLRMTASVSAKGPSPPRRTGPTRITRAPAITWPVGGSITSPSALTATIAPTMTPPPTSTEAVPTPDFIAPPMPRIFPTLAPIPTPALPSHGGRDDGHFHRDDVEPRPVLLQVAHHAASGVEPERGSTCEKDRIHLLDKMEGMQQIGLARPGRPAPLIDAGDGPLGAENDGAAGERLSVVGVPDADAREIDEAVGCGHPFSVEGRQSQQAESASGLAYPAVVVDVEPGPFARHHREGDRARRGDPCCRRGRHERALAGRQPDPAS